MVMGRETTGDLEVANKFHKAAVTLLFDQMETKPWQWNILRHIQFVIQMNDRLKQLTTWYSCTSCEYLHSRQVFDFHRSKT